MILAGLLLPLVVQTQTAGPTQDPAWPVLKQLLGGHWEGVVGKSVKVRFKFSLLSDGQMIRGDGIIGVGSLHPLTAQTSIGWDPQAKQLYYLDQHGFDTVYFGHVTLQDNVLVWDFKALCGDSGHYQSHETITGDEYTDSMRVEQDGKWTDMGFHLHLHRVK